MFSPNDIVQDFFILESKKIKKKSEEKSSEKNP